MRSPLRVKLAVVSGLPFALGLAVLVLFVTSSNATMRANEHVAAWSAHSFAVWKIELATERYLDAVDQQLAGRARPEQLTLARRGLADAISASRQLASGFSADEQEGEARLHRELADLIGRAQAALRAAQPPAFAPIRARYQRRVVPLLKLRMGDEYAGIHASLATQRRQNLQLVAVAGGVTAILLIGGLAASVVIARRMSKALTALTHQVRTLHPAVASGSNAPSAHDEFAALAQTLSDLAGSLARQRHGRFDVLTGLAHDVRNPLTILKLTSDMGEAASASPARVEQAMTSIRRQVARLEEMLEELGDVAAIEAGQIELHLAEADVCRLARESVELHAEAAAHHTVTVRAPETPIALRCDPARIRRVLDNLIGNAIKYSPAGTQVAVELAASPHEVTICVSDSGPGIAPQDRERIFEPYQRGSSGTDVIPGAGLGLAISRHIAAAHGGSLELQCATGSGSAFLLHLPVARSGQIPRDTAVVAD